MSDIKNADRIERVSQALSLYDDPNDLRSNVVDILADLMHIWSEEGVDEPFHELVRLGAVHHVAELEEENFVEGNVVFWTDPDEGACSGYFRVVFVDPHSTTLHLAAPADTTNTVTVEALRDECTIISNA